jgi:hypothetical protein
MEGLENRVKEVHSDSVCDWLTEAEIICPAFFQVLYALGEWHSSSCPDKPVTSSDHNSRKL